MHPTRAASLLAALGAALIAAALLLRALSLGQAFAASTEAFQPAAVPILTTPAAEQEPGEEEAAAQPSPTPQPTPTPLPVLPALGGYRAAEDGQTIYFIQAPPSAPRTLVSWYSMPADGGVPAIGTAPPSDLRPFRVASGQAYVFLSASRMQAGSPPGERVTEARRSPDGRALAFTAETEGGQARLYILDEAARLEWLGEEDTIYDIDWSPDGTRLAFVAPRERVDQVIIASADGQEYRQLTSDPARKSRPRWSPDSASIAYLAVEGGYSPTIGLATPTVPAVILAPTLTPAAGAPPLTPSRADVYLVGLNGANPRRLTDSAETEMALAWLRSRRGAELSFAARLPEHPQIAYLYAIEPASGQQRRVYPALAVERIECPARFADDQPAAARITVSNSALVPLDLPLILRAGSQPFEPYGELQTGAVRSETVGLLPGETRVLEWPVPPSGGRSTHLSVIAETDPRLPLGEQHCSAPNTYLGLPNLPYLALGLPLLLLGALLCIPRLLQMRRRLFWVYWAAGPLAFLAMYVLEMLMG